MSKHTPGPWSQGYIVDNNRLKHLPKEQLEVFETDEKLSVYANFSPMDNGRGRNLIAIAYSVNDAARIVECVNACEGIEDPSQLKNSHREYLLTRGLLRDSEQQNKRMTDACAALIEWHRKYPPGRVYNWDRAATIESELTACIEGIKVAITGTIAGGGQP